MIEDAEERIDALWPLKEVRARYYREKAAERGHGGDP